jgi:hypothetical protein
MLAGGIDWTGFVRSAINHGLTGQVGRALAGIARELVPAEILGAFQTNFYRTRLRNRARLLEVVNVIDSLTAKGIGVIPLKGPLLALEAYGDLGLREFHDLDFLVRDRDMTAMIDTLQGLGYRRPGHLSRTQFELIHRLQGQEILFSQLPDSLALEPHTRLTPIKMALNIDHEGMWQRAHQIDLEGHQFLTLAQEDELLALAIHGGKELWWNIKWACDVANFVRTHPNLDWDTVVRRARAQGCLRIILLATSLAHKFLGAAVPDNIVQSAAGDSVIQSMTAHILKGWQADEPVGPPSSKRVSMNLLRLHDGLIPRVNYVGRTLLLPGPQHIAMVSLPGILSAGYIPIKFAHDLVALPLWRIYQHIRGPARGA